MNKVKEFFKRNYYLLTSLLYFLSFPSFDILFLKGYVFFAWFALIPLFLWIKQEKSLKKIYSRTFLTGFLGHLLAFNWISAFGEDIPFGPVMVLAFLMPTLAFFFSAKIIAAEWLSRKYPALRIIIFPVTWIIVDWVESIGYLAFPWPYLGYSQFSFTPFIQVASVTGILGINFIMVLFAISLSEFILQKKSKSMSETLHTKEGVSFTTIISFIVIITIGGYFTLYRNKPVKSENPLNVAMVQSCISPWEDWNRNKYKYLGELKRYTTAAITEQKNDLVIWSESATLELLSYDYMYNRNSLSYFEQDVFNMATENQVYLLTGEIGYKPDLAHTDPIIQNNAVLINNLGEVVDTYAKINLVPFGEWFPYKKWFPHIDELLKLAGGSDFIPGDVPFTFRLKERGYDFGVLICYEGIFYRLCREYKKKGAEFLVNITNDGWTSSYSGHYQHFSSSIFRAVENGLWVLRAGNTGYTAVIDPYGRIKKSIPILKKGYLVTDIDVSANHSTVYSMCGDVLLYISMLFFVVLLVLTFYTDILKKKFSVLKNKTE